MSRVFRTSERQVVQVKGACLIPVRMTVIRKITCWQGCRLKGAFVYCWSKCKLMQPLWESMQRVLERLTMEPPYDQIYHFLVFTPRLQVNVPQRSCISVCTKYRTTQVSNSGGRDTDNVCTQQNYFHSQRKEVTLFAGEQMKLEIVLLSKLHQSQKDPFYIFAHLCTQT